MRNDEKGAEDLELIHRFLRGEEKAFELLMGRYYHKIDRLACQIIGNPATAEDIVQEVFLRVYQALPRFRGESAFYSWLYRITINLCLNYLRRQPGPSLAEKEMPLQTAASPDPSSLLEARQREVLLRRAIEALPPHYRVVIILRDLEGLRYQEIAHLLGIPVGTVKSRISVGKRLLKEQLLPLLDEEAS